MNNRFVGSRLKNKLSSYGKLKSDEDIKLIRESGIIISDIFSRLSSFNMENASTLEIDSFVEDKILSAGARPSFATVKDYSFATCVSINNEVIHGIPSKRKIISKGDIVKIDIGVVKKGYFADSCRTFIVGDVSPEVKDLVDSTYNALHHGISKAVIGNTLGDIGFSIENFVLTRGYSVVKDYTGHGTGFAVHEPPAVLHYGAAGSGLPLIEGMVIAIEPMVNEKSERVCLMDDGWTVVTEDGGLSAQFEHTVAITKNGTEILTI